MFAWSINFKMVYNIPCKTTTMIRRIGGQSQNCSWFNDYPTYWDRRVYFWNVKTTWFGWKLK